MWLCCSLTVTGVSLTWQAGSRYDDWGVESESWSEVMPDLKISLIHQTSCLCCCLLNTVLCLTKMVCCLLFPKQKQVPVHLMSKPLYSCEYLPISCSSLLPWEEASEAWRWISLSLCSLGCDFSRSCLLLFSSLWVYLFLTSVSDRVLCCCSVAPCFSGPARPCTGGIVSPV